jgi:hypothetical protein
LLAGSSVGRVPSNADELIEFPYSCDLCDRPFRELNHLLQHKTAKHKASFRTLQQQQQKQPGNKPSMIMPLRFLLPNHDHNNRQHNESHESRRYKQYQDWDDYNDYYDDDD